MKREGRRGNKNNDRNIALKLCINNNINISRHSHISCTHSLSLNRLMKRDRWIIVKGKNTLLVETSLQGSLNEVADRCGSNSVMIHPAKTKRMVIATRQKHQLSPLQLKLTLEKTDIEQVHEHHVLGVTIDVKMIWQSYRSNVCKIVSKNHFPTFSAQVLCKCYSTQAVL